MKYNNYRRASKEIKVGRVCIGGNNPIAVQSMTNVSSSDYDALYNQIKSLENEGCDIVRMTVPDKSAVENLHRLKCSDISLPIVADIHFDYRLAIESASAGADKIRINPGNIGGEDRVRAVVSACRSANIPIRIGVNGGSLEKELLSKYGSPTPEALAESALYHVSLLEKYDFDNIIVAVKSSDVRNMIKANRILADKISYPLHLGVTEAGTHRLGVLRSASGIGSLLCDGIGDTLRISLTDAPELEVREGKALLSSLGLNEKNKVRVVSCPTCGRTRIDLIGIASELEKRLEKIELERELTVAVMGCAVNGPGEAKEADIGIAGGDGEALLFKKGQITRKLPEKDLVSSLLDEIIKMGK